MTLFHQASVALRRTTSPRGLVSVICLTALGLICGCEDSAAQYRVEAQQAIAAASTDFRKATAGTVVYGDEHFDQRLRDLNGVVSRVSNLSNSEPGQQAAGGMLAGEALMELATMHLSHAQQIQQLNRQDRRALESMVSAATRLHSRAAAQASLSTSAEKASLQRERQAAEAALNGLQQRINALEGPIADRTRNNVQGEAEADRLRSEANDLIRRAIELGHSRGFPSYQQAISTRRDADEIDYEIAMRELELDYELHPESQFAQLQAEYLRRSVQSIRETLDELDRLDRLFAEDLGKTRQRVTEMQQNVSRTLRSLTERIEGDLAEQYETARGHLERAASLVQQAAGRLRGDQASAARLLQARIYETLGQSLWAEANALAEHLQLFSQIVEAGESIGGTTDHRRKAETLTARRRTLIEEAQAAFSEAEQALSSVTGRAADAVELFRQNLQRASSAVAGQPIGPTPSAPSISDWSSPGEVGSGQGFASPAEALAFLQMMDWGNQTEVDRFFAAFDTSDPQAAAMLPQLRPVIEAMMAFEQAVSSQFGEMDSSMGIGAPDFANARIDYETSERATIAFNTAMGEDTMELVNINGEWYMDAADLTSDLPVGDEIDDATLRNIMQTLSNGFSNLARRVRNGEFNSMEEVEEAAGIIMMQLMMQAFQ